MMWKFVYVFLPLCLMPCQVFASVTGTKDTRRVIGWVGEKPEYVDKLSTTANIWNTAKYNNYVCIKQGKICASGEFISPKHILTNTHVAKGCGINGAPECTIQTSDEKILSAKVVFYGGATPTSFESLKGTDWSILEITTPNFCSKHYFDYVQSTPVDGGMWRAGFGQLRVMSDKEFDAVRQAYTVALMKSLGKGPVDAAITANTKGLEIKYNALSSNIMAYFQYEFSELTGENFVKDFLYDHRTLKLVDNCAILEKTPKYAHHSCHLWAGDSGSSIQNKSDQITLLNEMATLVIGGEKHSNDGVTTESIFSEKVTDVLSDAKENCDKESILNPGLTRAW